MHLWTITFLLFSNFFLCEQSQYNETHPLVLLDAIFWEIKPFIFTNEHGQIDGIIPKMFKQAYYYCTKNNKSIRIINYHHRLSSRKEFYDLVRSNQSYGTGMLADVKSTQAFWAPVLSRMDRSVDTFDQKRHLKQFQLMRSKEMAVIVQRSLISLPNKILRGILSCKQIFVFAILLAVLFAIVLWLIEHVRNKEFTDSFIKGAAIGLYWSIVSMTTVGYGDITPKSVIGRCIASFWLFVGVMIGCVMTATMTDVVTGVDDLSVFGKTVSVLENSYEEKIAAQDYRAKVVPVPSYEKALEMVRRGEVFAAMINADVAAWYQDEISDDIQDVPLRIVQKLPANLHINCYVPIDIATEMKKTFKCMYYSSEEIYTYAIEAFQRYSKAETLYIGSSEDLFYSNRYIQVFFGFICVIILCGVAFDVYRYLKHKKIEKPDKEMIRLAITNMFLLNGKQEEEDRERDPLQTCDP